MAKTLVELPVYRKAQDFWRAVSALLAEPALRKDRTLHQQISDANDSIIANMHEGFEQPTDRAFANFLRYSKASLAEVLGRLELAQFKGHIPAAAFESCKVQGEELGRMLGGFINYLLRCEWKDRGRSREQGAGNKDPA